MTALSIVIPAYNEAARLADGVGRLTEAVTEGAVNLESIEVIVVDDGSTDDTADVASALLGPLPRWELQRLGQNRGKGAAVRAGVQSATGRAVAYMDADMAIHPRQLPALVAALEDADVAIGSRAHGHRSVTYSTRRRTLEGRVYNRAVNALTGVHLADTQCGFKAFRAPVAQLLFGATVIERFAFDMEVLSLARRLGMRIAEVPVEWIDVPGSRIRTLRDPVSMLLDLVRSRTGRLPAAPVTMIELPGTGPDAAVAALGDPALPVLARRGGGATVVAGEGQALGLLEQVAAALPGAEARSSTVTAQQLSALSPVELVWPEESADEVGTMTECPTPGTSPPGNGPPR